MFKVCLPFIFLILLFTTATEPYPFSWVLDMLTTDRNVTKSRQICQFRTNSIILTGVNMKLFTWYKGAQIYTFFTPPLFSQYHHVSFNENWSPTKKQWLFPIIVNLAYISLHLQARLPKTNWPEVSLHQPVLSFGGSGQASTATTEVENRTVIC